MQEIRYYFEEGLFLSAFFGTLSEGKADKRVIIDAYSIGRKPCIKAPDASLYTILVQNSDYLTLQNLEVVNTGTERLAHRTGVKSAV